MHQNVGHQTHVRAVGGPFDRVVVTIRDSETIPVARHTRTLFPPVAADDDDNVAAALACGTVVITAILRDACVRVIIIESRTSCLMCELCVAVATTTTVPSNTSIENFRAKKLYISFIYLCLIFRNTITPRAHWTGPFRACL